MSPPSERLKDQFPRGSGRQVKLSAANRTRHRRLFPQLLRLWEDRTNGWVRGVTSFRDLGTRLGSHFWPLRRAPFASGDRGIAPARRRLGAAAPPPPTGAALHPPPGLMLTPGPKLTPPGPMLAPPGSMLTPPGSMLTPPGPMLTPPGPMLRSGEWAPAGRWRAPLDALLAGHGHR